MSQQVLNISPIANKPFYPDKYPPLPPLPPPPPPLRLPHPEPFVMFKPFLITNIVEGSGFHISYDVWCLALVQILYRAERGH